MPTWSKAVLRTIGVLDSALCLLGAYFLLSSVWGGVFTLEDTADAPHFKIAFMAMTAINAGFLILFGWAAFQLLFLRKTGVIVHAITSALLIAYEGIVPALWHSGHGIGISVATATGAGNMGIAPFELFFVVPYLYPIASTLLLLVAGRKITATLHASRGPAQ